MSTGDDPYSLGQPKSNGRPAAVLSRSRSSASPSPRISPSPSRSGSPSPRLSPRPSRSGSPSPRQSPRVQEQLLISKYERKMNRMAKNFHKLKEAGVSNDDAVAVMLRAKRFLGPTTSRGVRERDLINLVTAAKASSTKRVVKEGTDAKPVPKDPTTTAEKRLPSSDADNASLDWFHQARDSFANPPRSKGELITHFRQIPSHSSRLRHDDPRSMEPPPLRCFGGHPSSASTRTPKTPTMSAQSTTTTSQQQTASGTRRASTSNSVSSIN